MTTEEHRLKHVSLHENLDELIADFISHTGKLPSKTNLIELIVWSLTQTKEPTETSES